MSPIYAWLIAYAVPALGAGAVVKIFPGKEKGLSKRNVVVTHATLAVSICLSQYFIHAAGQSFPWHPKPFPAIVYIASVLIAATVLGRKGLWYGLSAFIQQLTMLSTAFLLLPAFPWYAAALLIVPLYVWCHSLKDVRWRMKAALFAAWGTASIFLFSVLPDIYLLASLHTLLGTLLISRSFLYPEA